MFGFQFIEHGVEALKVCFPNLAVTCDPFGGFSEWLGFEAAWAALRVAAARDHAGAFEDFEMFGNGGLRHSERLGEIVDGGFTGSEAGEDGAARRIGESSESGIEVV